MLRGRDITSVPYTKNTCSSEILAFIGLLYLRGLLGLNNHDVAILFNDLTGNPVFGSTMSKNRFKFLFSNISFDDFETRTQRWVYDRFTAIRDVFESFNHNCSSCIVPGDFLSLDETLYPMKTRIGFKQFNPNKPAKYELLFKSINACRYPYTFRTAPYVGKPKNHSNQEQCKFYVRGTEDTVKRLVTDLEQHTSLSGRNISYDRLYTSISLAKWLLERNITTVGTLQANRKGIPEEVKHFGSRDSNSYEVFWDESGKLILNSYIVNTKFRKIQVPEKETYCCYPILGTVKDNLRLKPAIYKLYEYTKGGTDIIDQRMNFCSSKAKSRRWTMTAFAYVLDTCRVNASTVIALNQSIEPRNTNSFNFGITLGLQLVRPFVALRSKWALSKGIQDKIQITLSEPREESYDSSQLCAFPVQSTKQRRCEVCAAEPTGRERDNMGRVFSQCQRCGKAIFKRHYFRFCGACQ